MFARSTGSITKPEGAAGNQQVKGKVLSNMEYKYPLSNEWEAARERLFELEAVADPFTLRNLERIGIRKGWHCLEVAGGGGSIARWLCRQVGASGHVVATDLEPRFLEAINEPNLEVWRRDIVRDALPEGRFDLIHARAVLVFLPQPEKAIAKMVVALKPGGWLLVEEPDFISAAPDPSMSPASLALSRKGWDAVVKYLQSQGHDRELGRRLYHEVANLGGIRNGDFACAKRLCFA
jgi:SAM-dependent methyltransferase